MGKWSQLLTLVALSVLTQACNSTDTAAASNAPVPAKINTLKNRFIPKTTIQTTPEEIQGTVNYGKAKIEEQCERASWTPWCLEGNKQPLATKRLSYAKAHEISLSVQKGYVYTADPVDNWNSYSALHVRHETWYGDCDDLTSTTLDMLHRAGQPLDKMWMLLNNVRSRGTLDHVVGVIQTSDGRYYVVGDTDARSMYPIEKMTFSPRALARMDNPGVWVPADEHQMFKEHPRLLGIKAPTKQVRKRR